MQAANRSFSKLKAFRDSQPFDPKKLSARRGGHRQLITFVSRNLMIHKQILQFDSLLHADRLKTVTRAPMTQYYVGSNGISIENLCPGPAGFGPDCPEARPYPPFE